MLHRLCFGKGSCKVKKASKVSKEVYSVAFDVLNERYSGLAANNGKELAAEYMKMADVNCFEPCKHAEMRPNTKKNRYMNVLPFDYNRVKLTGESEYINASLLESPAGAEPGWRYIATQGPLGDTTADFWHMVQDAQCAAIVMLTRTVENRHIKCAEYFPMQKGAEMSSGGFSVSVLDVADVSEDITKRKLLLRDQAGSSRELEHYYYHRWPDHGVPEGTTFLRQLSSMLQSTGASDTTAVVHCSAGIGRTGTFCTVDIILRRLRWLAQAGVTDRDTIAKAVDIQSVVEELRRQRRGMVQTLDQYYFCYRAILEELRGLLTGGAR